MPTEDTAIVSRSIRQACALSPRAWASAALTLTSHRSRGSLALSSFVEIASPERAKVSMPPTPLASRLDWPSPKESASPRCSARLPSQK